MDHVTREDLLRLSRRRESWCVSLTMPIEPTGAETKEGPIVLKNLLKEAEVRLFDRGLHAPEVSRVLEPAAALVRDHVFWKQRGGGLALFLGPEGLTLFHLPRAFVPEAFVGKRFRITPLLPLVSGDDRHFILALSQNDVRLLEGSRFGVRRLDLGDTPTSLAAALEQDDPDPQFQYHTAGRAPGSLGGEEASMHGYGVGVHERKLDLERFFRRVSAGVARRLHGNDAPLILAGVDTHLPIYETIDTSPHRTTVPLRGNVDLLSDQDLHRRAWPLVERIVGAECAGQAVLCNELLGRGSARAMAGFESVVPAARDGRVRSLFVASGVRRWGTLDEASATARVHPDEVPGDDDLLDLAAAHTLASGGEVYALVPGEMPGGSTVAAVLRS